MKMIFTAILFTTVFLEEFGSAREPARKIFSRR